MIDIPRTYAAPFEEPPNTWKPIFWRGKLHSAIYTCPKGHVGLLDEHTILADGTVSPSVVCTTHDCTFHDYIRLEGWAEIFKKDTPAS